MTDQGSKYEPLSEAELVFGDYGKLTLDANEASKLTLAIEPADAFVIMGAADTPLVTISFKDGSLTYGEGYTPDAAAKAFWEAMGQYSPHEATIRDLQGQVKEARSIAQTLVNSEMIDRYCKWCAHYEHEMQPGCNVLAAQRFLEATAPDKEA